MLRRSVHVRLLAASWQLLHEAESSSPSDISTMMLQDPFKFPVLLQHGVGQSFCCCSTEEEQLAAAPQLERIFQLFLTESLRALSAHPPALSNISKGSKTSEVAACSSHLQYERKNTVSQPVCLDILDLNRRSGLTVGLHVRGGS